MSLWKVRHSLSPVIEASLIALAMSYGIFIIYLASVRPLVVAITSDIRSVPVAISLDTDEWDRATNVGSRYLFGIPSGWVIETSSEQRVAIARNHQVLDSQGDDMIVIETRLIGERNQVENIAAAEFSDVRPALYDIAVHGRSGLFSVEFNRGRISKQTVYVQVGDRVHIIRSGGMDPAAFSTFISTIKFLPETNL